MPNVPAPSRPNYHHGDLRRALLEAAVALIAEEQGWSFSLREVARRAGVSHNAPSRHFRDKGELLAALAVAGFQDLSAHLREVRGDRDASAALIAIGHAYVAFARDNPARYRLMFGPELHASDGELPPKVAQAASQAKAILADVIQAGARAGAFRIGPDDDRDLAVAVLSAWSLVHGLAMLTIDGMTNDASIPADVLAESAMRTLLNGLIVDAGRRTPRA